MLNGFPLVLLFVLFAALVIGLIIYGVIAAARRRKELAEWGRSRGLRFTPGQDGSLEDRYPRFDCLQQGSNRYGYNFLEGDWSGRPFLGFDYHYETYSTDSKGRRSTHHHHFSAVILGSEIPLEPLFIRPEGFFDKVKEFLGFDDIDFESAEFSRRFYVKSPDKRWAYDVIHPRTMEFLLAMPRFTIQFDRRCAIALDSSTFATRRFEEAAEILRGIFDRLPDYLVEQRRGRS